MPIARSLEEMEKEDQVGNQLTQLHLEMVVNMACMIKTTKQA